MWIQHAWKRTPHTVRDTIASRMFKPRATSHSIVCHFQMCHIFRARRIPEFLSSCTDHAIKVQSTYHPDCRRMSGDIRQAGFMLAMYLCRQCTAAELFVGDTVPQIDGLISISVLGLYARFQDCQRSREAATKLLPHRPATESKLVPAGS